MNLTKTGETGDRIAAIYLRLSRDDGLMQTESESIASQRLMLMHYAAQHGFVIAAEFCDDGVSGTKHDRIGLKALLQAIEDGWIRIVLVKDLSRLSRDYIHTGELLERWFPQHGVRLIAVNDGIDTAMVSAANDYSPIRAIMDDWYARDISRKVRSAIYARQAAGYCTIARLPYGYCRAEGAIQPVPEQVCIIRGIYRAYLSGQSCCAIARALTVQRVRPAGGGSVWNDVTVRRILTNPAYTGRLLLRTTQKTGYKCAKCVHLPAEAAVEYRIPAVIPDASFQQVQLLHAQRLHRTGEHPYWRKKVYCGCCGAVMHVHADRMRCSGRKRGVSCPNPSLRTDSFSEMLSAALQPYFQSSGLPVPAHLIRRIEVSVHEVIVYMICGQPDSKKAVPFSEISPVSV